MHKSGGKPTHDATTEDSLRRTPSCKLKITTQIITIDSHFTPIILHISPAELGTCYPCGDLLGMRVMWMLVEKLLGPLRKIKDDAMSLLD
jgi:uncharacterized protein YqfA (UPF0365 family)